MVTSVAQFVKNLPAMQETWAPSLDQEDPLEKHMATHASTFAWRIPWADKPGGLQSMELQRDTTEATNTHTHTHTHTLVTLVLDLLQIKGGLSIPHDPDPYCKSKGDSLSHMTQILWNLILQEFFL